MEKTEKPLNNKATGNEIITCGFALPGDIIGVNEEFIKGNQTFSQKGNIHATVTGDISVNRSRRSISIQPKVNKLSYIEKGDIVIGQVTSIRSAVALVEIAHVKGKGERGIINLSQAAVHVSNIKDTYVKDIPDELCPFDIIKARVIDVNTMRLTTADKELGVMKAFCSKCKQPLKKNAFGLICESCGNREKRKMSTDYGTGII